MSYLDKHYYPTHWSGCNPIHEVQDWAKVRRLIRDALKGDKINPILIEGDLGQGNLLTGTHRSAANDILVMLGKEEYLIPYITLADIEITKEIQEALENSDFEALNYIFDN